MERLSGHNGLLITPYYGTRHRISPIFVQEKLFEFTDTDEYQCLLVLFVTVWHRIILKLSHQEVLEKTVISDEALKRIKALVSKEHYELFKAISHGQFKTKTNKSDHLVFHLLALPVEIVGSTRVGGLKLKRMSLTDGILTETSYTVRDGFEEGQAVSLEPIRLMPSNRRIKFHLTF